MLRSALFVSNRMSLSAARSFSSQTHVLSNRPLLQTTSSILRSSTSFLPRAASTPRLSVYASPSSALSRVVMVPKRGYRGYPLGDKYGGTGWRDSSRSQWWRGFDGCKKIVYGLIAIQGVIFIMWQNKEHSWQKFMNDHFTASLYNLEQGRLYTLLTCCFSQANFIHMAVNSLVLYGFGPITCFSLGLPAFAALFLGSGLIASFAHLAYNKHLRDSTFSPRERLHRHFGGVLGASGSLAALFAVFACMNPAARVLLFGIVPIPAWGALIGGLALDSAAAISNVNDGVSHVGHIAGALSGVLFFWLRKNKPYRRLVFPRGRRF